VITRRPYPRTLLAALVVLAVMVSGAAIAWACTPDANIDARGPTGGNFGPQGKQVEVVGEGFVPGAEVKIRWLNEANEIVAKDWATARGPDFTVAATVPNLATGDYYVVATGRDPSASDGSGVRNAPIPFRVGESRAPDPDPGPGPTPGSGTTPNPAPGATPAPSASVPANPNPGSGSPAAGSSPDGTSAPRSPSRTRNGGDPAGRDRDTLRGRDAIGRDTLRGRDAIGDRGVVTTLPSGQPVFSDSLAGTGPNGESSGLAPATSVNSAPSERSAGGDLRSGLSTEPGSAQPGLGGAPATAGSSGSPLVAGMALLGLGLGLVALVGSAGLARARRRRQAHAVRR